jgi:GMP synthase (glutamine-hydrolysing)
MSPRVLLIQPTPYAPVGRLGDWLEWAGLELEVISPSEGDAVPAAPPHDAVVVMGGSMGANDDSLYPWLTELKALLARSAADGLPTLGVCLGHQLLAVACGGRVVRNDAGITAGLRRVGLSPGAASDPLHEVIGSSPVAVQWNNDIVVRMPPGGSVLASTESGVPQAIRTGERAWGVQFHPEADVHRVRNWAERDIAAGTMTPDAAEPLLDEIEAADQALVASWRPWAERFAAIVVAYAAR